MRKTFVALFALLVGCSFAEAGAYKPPVECEGKVPHYLTGFSQPDDQIDTFFQVNQNFVVSDADSLANAVWGANLGERVELTFHGHTVTLYLPTYRRNGGMVYAHSKNGVTPLTEQEFACVKADLREWIQGGIDKNYETHKVITDIAVASFAKRTGKTAEEVRGLLGKSIPEYGTNYADVLKIPLLEPVDFIQSIKYIYFTPLRSCNAAVSMNTIVLLTPCVRRTDFILGHAEVVTHELIHANTKLQGYPIGWYVNVELMAALFPFLDPPTSLDTFFYHSYLMTPWEGLKVFGGFDVKKVRKEIYRYGVMGRGAALNREALTKYLPEVNRAAAWLRESATKVLGEYYSDPHVWAAINDAAYDDDMFYKVIMAKLYEPTLLDGHAKTVRFILKHADQSADVAKKALERVGKRQTSNGDNHYRERLFQDLQEITQMLGVTPEVLERLGRMYGFHTATFAQMDPEILRRLIRDFLNREGILSTIKEMP